MGNEHVLVAKVPIVFDAELVDIGWAWALAVDGDDVILVRKRFMGNDIAKSIATKLLLLMKNP